VNVTVSNLPPDASRRGKLVHTGLISREPDVPASPDEIRLQLDRMLASATFSSADRMSGFLRYVVERALAGEGDQIKEYVIGVAVFGRGDDYDPRLDSIVRVEARRLRTKLDEYYAADGRDDTIVIAIPRGSYSPTFEQRVPQAAAPLIETARELSLATPSRWRPGLIAVGLALLVALPLAFLLWNGALTSVGRATPMVTIAVLPFAEYSNDPGDELLAARLTDGVTSELARIKTLGVVSHTSALQFAGTRRPIKEIAQALNAELILEGSVHHEGDKVRIEARIVDTTIDRKLWVDDFVGTAAEPRELERRVAIAAGNAAERSRGR
jgi:adenylate cyclase